MDHWEFLTAKTLLGGALCGLGIIALAVPGPLGGWMPLPEWLPGGAAVGRVMGLLLFLLGAALLALPDVRRVLVGISALFVSWIVILHPERLVTNRFSLGAWLGVAEVAAVAAACWLLLRLLNGRAWAAQAKDQKVTSLILAIYGIALIVFGLCHFVYLDITASMVPDWLPGRPTIAILTGIAHVAAGLALLSGLQDRLAMQLLTAMFGSFVLLVHVPRAGADPANRGEWLLLATSLLLTASAWVMAILVAQRPDGYPAGLRALRGRLRGRRVDHQTGGEHG